MDGRLHRPAIRDDHTATSVDTVLVAEGVYKPGAARGDSFVLVDGVEAYGGFPAGGSTMELRDPSLHPTILSGEINGAGAGDNSLHVLVIDPFVATCVVDGFTITRGYADGSGNGGQGAGSSSRTTRRPSCATLSSPTTMPSTTAGR